MKGNFDEPARSTDFTRADALYRPVLAVFSLARHSTLDDRPRRNGDGQNGAVALPQKWFAS